MSNQILAAALLSLCTVPFADGAEPSWPSFRGPDRTGVAAESGLLARWPSDGPKLVWETSGAGRGYASLAIVDGKIYTIGDSPSTANDDSEYLICFRQSDGKPLWKSETGPPWTDGPESWQSSRSTPTVGGDRIFVVTPHGELICFGTDGESRWSRNFREDFSGQKADGWGYSESVLIDGDRLICTPGGPDHTVVALDKRTGEEIWSCSRADDRGAGHSSVVISEIGGTRVYVQATGSGAMGIRADDGELLWTDDIEEITSVIPTPIVRGDLVFYTSAYGLGGTLLRQNPSANRGVSIEKLYGPRRELMNKHGGVVLVGDYLYGDTEDRGVPFCADLMTGRLEWKSRGSGRKSASITAADGRLYIRYSDGTMTLVNASPESLQELGSFKVPGSGDRPSWSHPVVLDGKLYLREGDKVLCYAVRE